MTSRSAERGLLAIALAACLLGLPPARGGADSAAAAAPEPSVTATPDPLPASLVGVDAPVVDLITPVVDLVAPVDDLITRVSSLDATRTTIDQGPTRRLVLASSVLFAESRSELSPAALATLADAAQQVRASGAHGTVTVDGYTDDQGSAAIGLVLSRRRAAAVTAVLGRDLAGLGFTFAQHGYGEADPIAPNEHPDKSPDRAGQARNRRVVIGFTPSRR